MASRRVKPAFTLVELLVVIGIIALLVTLLVPVIAMATQTVQVTRTRTIIKNLGFALENFKTDFGFYPPSRPEMSVTNGTNALNPINVGPMKTGALNLFYYLAGPGRSGWGVGGGGRMPGESQSGTPIGKRPTKTYGPYYEATDEQLKYDMVGTTVTLGGYKDAFKPGGKILYFRYDPNPVGKDSTTGPYNFDVGHNYYAPGTQVWQPGIGDKTCGATDYGNQVMFEEVVRGSSSTVTGVYPRWLRPDYFLVSPGPDGRYGYTKQKKADPDAGTYAPASRDAKADDAYNAPVSPDDITNW